MESTSESRAIGAAVRALRALRGMSQTEMSKAVGMSRTVLFRIEKGESPPAGWMLSKILLVVGATVDDFEALRRLAEVPPEAEAEEHEKRAAEAHDRRIAAAVGNAVKDAYLHQFRLARGGEVEEESRLLHLGGGDRRAAGG